jgi:hypothetical protein
MPSYQAPVILGFSGAGPLGADGLVKCDTSGSDTGCRSSGSSTSGDVCYHPGSSTGGGGCESNGTGTHKGGCGHSGSSTGGGLCEGNGGITYGC